MSPKVIFRFIDAFSSQKHAISFPLSKAISRAVMPYNQTQHIHQTLQKRDCER